MWIVSRDAIRAAMFDPCEYTSAEKEAAFEALLSGVHANCSLNRPVAVDGIAFSEEGYLERVAEVAAESGARLIAVYCVCPIEVACERVEADQRLGRHVAADRDRELVERTAARFREVPQWAYRLNMTRPLDELGEEVLTLLPRVSSVPSEPSGSQ
jgi:predicted kinase